MSRQITATDIIDSVTDAAVAAVSQIWEEEGITGTRAEFAAAVLRVQEVMLPRHLAKLNEKEPGRGDKAAAQFVREYEATQA